MKNIINKLNSFFGEYLERLILILAGFGIGVKVMVINHNIDPSNLNLRLMPADYVILVIAPLAATLLSQAISKWGQDQEAEQEDLQDMAQDMVNEILEDSGIDDGVWLL